MIGPFLWALAVILSAISGSALAGTDALPPCETSRYATIPEYGPLKGSPVVGVWRDTAVALGQNCPAMLNGPAELVIVLAGRFKHAGTLKDLAAWVGAVSAMEKLQYWSVTDGKWRTLISEAYALDGSEKLSQRSDFTAEEILSGRTLYMAQKDTRSTGTNFYALTGEKGGRDQLSVSVINLSDIHFLLATVFRKRTLVSSYFLTRLSGDEWGYYSMTIIRQGAIKGSEKSLINRAAAYLRLLIGDQPDKEPPVAR